MEYKTTRYFDYKEANAEFHDAYFIAKKITESLNSLINNSHLTSDEKDIVQKSATEANFYLEEIDLLGDIYSIESTVNHDLLEPWVVDYYYENNIFPENASEIGQTFQESIQKIFYLEDKIAPIVSNIWKRTLTPFESIKNGDKFITVAHSTTLGLDLNNSFKNNLNPYLSCSIFNNNCMNYYNGPVAITFDINKDNYIASASFDSATASLSSNQSIFTLKTFPNGETIRAGYTFEEDPDKIVIKCEKPDDVLNRINSRNSKNRVVNETVLDKKFVKPKGILLFSDGIDYLLPFYLIADKMSKQYNIPIKLIDRRKYNTNELEEINTSEFLKQISQTHYDLINNSNLNNLEKQNIIKNFYELIYKEKVYSNEKLNICYNEITNLYNSIDNLNQKKI